MKKFLFIILIILPVSVFFPACENNITSRFDTVKAKTIELTNEEGETIAKVKAAKDASGKSVVNIMDAQGNIIGSFQAK